MFHGPTKNTFFGRGVNSNHEIVAKQLLSVCSRNHDLICFWQNSSRSFAQGSLGLGDFLLHGSIPEISSQGTGCKVGLPQSQKGPSNYVVPSWRAEILRAGSMSISNSNPFGVVVFSLGFRLG